MACNIDKVGSYCFCCSIPARSAGMALLKTSRPSKRGGCSPTK